MSGRSTSARRARWCATLELRSAATGWTSYPPGSPWGVRLGFRPRRRHRPPHQCRGGRDLDRWVRGQYGHVYGRLRVPRPQRRRLIRRVGRSDGHRRRGAAATRLERVGSVGRAGLARDASSARSFRMRLRRATVGLRDAICSPVTGAGAPRLRSPRARQRRGPRDGQADRTGRGAPAPRRVSAAAR